MNLFLKSFAVAVAAAVGLTGCTLGPEPERPATAADVGESYVHAGDEAGPELPEVSPWWRTFGDETTVELVELALENNTDLCKVSDFADIADPTKSGRSNQHSGNEKSRHGAKPGKLKNGNDNNRSDEQNNDVNQISGVHSPVSSKTWLPRYSSSHFLDLSSVKQFGIRVYNGFRLTNPELRWLY